jgi:hypothetical protein
MALWRGGKVSIEEFQSLSAWQMPREKVNRVYSKKDYAKDKKIVEARLKKLRKEQKAQRDDEKSRRKGGGKKLSTGKINSKYSYDRFSTNTKSTDVMAKGRSVQGGGYGLGKNRKN